MKIASALLFCGMMASVLDAAPAQKQEGFGDPKMSPGIRPSDDGAIVLDSFTRMDWASANHDGTTVEIARVDGKQGKALQLKYDLANTGQWVAVSKPFEVSDLLKGKAIEFWVRGVGKANILELKLIDADGSTFGSRFSGVTNLKEWTLQSVNVEDLTHWWGGDDKLDAVKEISFAISSAQGGSGQTELDELRLVDAVRLNLPEGVVSDGESAAGWEVSQGKGAFARLSTGKGKAGSALMLDYEIPANQWVSVRHKNTMKVDPKGTLSLWVRGSGAENNLEIKFVDKDGSTFGKVFPGVTAQERWQQVRVPVAEMEHLWGGDDKLDVANVQFIDFAVSGGGGQGVVFLDDMKFEK